LTNLSTIKCISNREMPSDLPRNINHFQADLLKGFLNENLSTGSTSYPKLSAMELGDKIDLSAAFIGYVGLLPRAL
jgi:hypothetical protein